MASVHIQENLFINNFIEELVKWELQLGGGGELVKWKVPILFYRWHFFIVIWKLILYFILCLSFSDFLVPDYLNQEQEETLVQYDLGEHTFESNSSVQMPVISQVSSTQNCESSFPLGSLGGLAEKEEEVQEQPKTSVHAEATQDDPPKSELSSITIE